MEANAVLYFDRQMNKNAKSLDRTNENYTMNLSVRKSAWRVWETLGIDGYGLRVSGWETYG